MVRNRYEKKCKYCMFTGGIIGVVTMMLLISMWLFEEASGVFMYGVTGFLEILSSPLFFIFNSSSIGLNLLWLLFISFIIGMVIELLIRRFNKRNGKK